MKKYLIPIIISAIVVISYFAIAQSIIPEQRLSKQCDIPYDENFIKRRSIVSSNDGTPRFSIGAEFSIFHSSNWRI